LTDAQDDAPARRIPRSCSDVYRLWAAVGLGLLVTLLIDVGVDAYTTAGMRGPLTAAQAAVEADFGADLFGWVGFATAYLGLGIRAFYGCDHDELLRRVLGSPLPRSRFRRWVLAGGGGIGWPVVIAIWAFSTTLTAVINRKDVGPLVLTFAGLTVLSCVAIITFSFALFYARRDIEHGGIEFTGPDPAVFSDYVYLAVGCSVTFGTTDTSIASNAVRRIVTFHSALAWTLNTVVIAVMLSLVTN
jgi:hypothetical protein